MDFNAPLGKVTEDEARLVIASAGALANPTPMQASDLAAQLLGFYPAREVNNAQIYANGMTALFGAYPLKFGKKVCNPVTGLPSRLKWLPTMADVKEMLEAEKLKRDRILWNAQRIINLIEEERRKAAEEAERPSLEERRALAERIVNQTAAAMTQWTDEKRDAA